MTPTTALPNSCGSLKCPGNRGESKNEEEGNDNKNKNHYFMLFELEDKAQTFIPRGANVNATCVRKMLAFQAFFNNHGNRSKDTRETLTRASRPAGKRKRGFAPGSSCPFLVATNRN